MVSRECIESLLDPHFGLLLIALSFSRVSSTRSAILLTLLRKSLWFGFWFLSFDLPLVVIRSFDVFRPLPECVNVFQSASEASLQRVKGMF